MAVSVQLRSVYRLLCEQCDINSLRVKLLHNCNQGLKSVCSQFSAIQHKFALLGVEGS